MTTARAEPAVAVENVEAAVDALRRRQLRVSTARRLVLEALFASDGPISAEQIATGGTGQTHSDLASVYRNLELLEEVGLVRHVHLGHGAGLYALAQSAREYLVCESCSTVRALEPGELDEVRRSLVERFGFEARFGHFPIVGRCARCAAVNPRAKER